MTEILCVLDHGNDQAGEPRLKSADVGYLCRNHRARLDTTASNIRELWFDLSLILEAGSAPKDETPKTKHLKSAEAPAPANLDALALRDHRNGPTLQPCDVPAVLNVVASWLLVVAEERPLTETRHRRGPLTVVKNRFEYVDIAYTAPMTLPKGVLGQLDLLVRHHNWIAEQPFIDDYVLEMNELVTALKAAVRDHTHRTLGHCRLPVEDGYLCGGALLEENGTRVVRCSGCGAQWVTPQEVARLAVSLEEPG